MTLVELRKIVNDLEIEIKNIEHRIELNFLKTQPKPMDLTKEMVGGTKVVDKLAIYVIKQETLEHRLSIKNESLKEYQVLLDERVEALSKSDMGGYIRYLRDVCNKQWGEIADITSYSISTCQRKYKKDLT